MKIGKFLSEYAFGVELNMNDVFCPAADSEFVELEELPGLIELADKFGFDGVKAFVGVKRGCDPIWHPRRPPSETYYKAKAYIESDFVNSGGSLYPKSLARQTKLGGYLVSFAKFLETLC